MATTIYHTTSLFKRFLSLPGEEILLATRTHWTVLIPSFIVLAFLAVSLHVGAYLGFILLTRQIPLYLLTTLLITIFTIAIITKVLTEWYYHLYIITNRKILELSYSLLFSYSVNDVLLDQVRCTEIDTKMNGIVDRLFDKGTVCITFDRPTHQEEFKLEDIPQPEKIGIFLGDAFDTHTRNDNLIWYRDKYGSGYRFTDTYDNEKGETLPWRYL